MADPVVGDDEEDTGLTEAAPADAASADADAAPADAAPADAALADAALLDAAPVEVRCRLVWVLDYSGSMEHPLGGSTRIELLRAAVASALGQPLPIDHGLVIFSSEVQATVAPGRDAPEAIRAVLGLPADGNTNYSAAIAAAAELLGELESSSDVALFASDGAPTAGGDPYPAADALRAGGVTVFTLNIGGGGAQSDLLKDMSGTAERPGDEAFSFEARDEAQLTWAVAAFLAALPCAQ